MRNPSTRPTIIEQLSKRAIYLSFFLFLRFFLFPLEHYALFAVSAQHRQSVESTRSLASRTFIRAKL
jgi:hypothetical protein